MEPGLFDEQELVDREVAREEVMLAHLLQALARVLREIVEHGPLVRLWLGFVVRHLRDPELRERGRGLRVGVDVGRDRRMQQADPFIDRMEGGL